MPGGGTLRTSICCLGRTGEYFTFVDLGLGRATLKYVAEALGKGDKDRMSRLVWTAVTSQVFLGFLGTLALISMTAFLTQHMLHIPLHSRLKNRLFDRGYNCVALLVRSTGP
jgi:hypothetical protein